MDQWTEQRTGARLNRGRSKQDYGTPWEFIRAVEERFEAFTFDLACTRENAKASAGFYFDEADSLVSPWPLDGVCWLNPPFANIADWSEKCAATAPYHRGRILLLTPASIGTDWFSRFVNRKAMVLGIASRLTFEGTTDPYPKDLMLSIYGDGVIGFDCWRWK